MRIGPQQRIKIGLGLGYKKNLGKSQKCVVHLPRVFAVLHDREHMMLFESCYIADLFSLSLPCSLLYLCYWSQTKSAQQVDRVITKVRVSPERSTLLMPIHTAYVFMQSTSRSRDRLRSTRGHRTHEIKRPAFHLRAIERRVNAAFTWP